MTTKVWVAGLCACAAWPVAALAAEPQEEQQCDQGSDVIGFRTGSSRLGEDARRQLDQVAQWVTEQDDRSLTVEGYTDSSGSSTVNEKLSKARARAVERYLERQGIDDDRIETYGRGEAMTTTPADAAGARVVVVNRCEMQAATPPEQQPANPPAVTPEQQQETPPPVEETPQQPRAETEAPPPAVVETPPPSPPAPPPEEVSPNAGEVRAAVGNEPKSLQSNIGVAVSAGGGVLGFADKETRDIVDVGGSWDARIAFGTRLPIGFELGYTGSASRINATGLSNDAFLLGNGAEADLRFGIPFRYVRPYFFGGVGWTHFSIANSSTAGTAVNGSDDVGLVPFGAGLAVGDQGGFQFDLRGTGRATFANDNMLNGLYAGTGKEARLHSWAVTARIGWEF